jgi:hypothetical protein
MSKTTARYVRLLAAIGILAIGCSVSAKSVNSNAGTSAFSFLKISTGARPVAMGGAYTGLADDENSLFYNPAGVTVLDRPGYILDYHNYFIDLQSGLVGYITQYKGKHHVAAYINYLNYGKFTETNNIGEIEGEFGGGNVVLGLTYGRQYNEALSFGATGKLIYEKVHDVSAHGVAFDLGVRYSGDRSRYTAGFMVQNLGVQLSNFTSAEKDALPITFRLGTGARPRGLPVQFVGDIIFPVDNDISFAIGGEYYDLKPLYLRIGWNSFGLNYRAAESDDSWAGLSLGLGFDWRSMQVSYAFSPGAELGDSHRITLTGGI